MGAFKNALVTIGIVGLLFFAIPFHIDSPNNQPDLQDVFKEYVEKFNKTYRNDPKEYQLRLNNFEKSMQEIDLLNQVTQGPPGHKALYGPTVHSDLSKQEFRDLRLSDEVPVKNVAIHGRTWLQHPVKNEITNEAVKDTDKYVFERRKRDLSTLPETVDWRRKNAISGVYNQGVCGACWAFSTIETIESMVALQTGNLKELSVQQMIDCAGEGNFGCLGGDICTLLSWLTKTDTSVLYEETYPLNKKESVCEHKNATGVRVAHFTCDDLSKNENEILMMLATHGPVTVAVNAATWQNYLGGVIQFHCSGKKIDLNHAVQLVGYDLTAEVPYYIARNSWGVEFGDKGYLKLAIGDNVCGLANEVSSVDVLL